ncbi:hypothetical protein CHUAL_009566 [Chamberlinius hualienensis]
MVGVNENVSNFNDEYTLDSPPDENDSENVENEDDNEGQDSFANEELLNEPEMQMLNEQIDQLNSCLDEMERQNDVLKTELLELLESNRQTRQEFASERERLEKVANISINDKSAEKQS